MAGPKPRAMRPGDYACAVLRRSDGKLLLGLRSPDKAAYPGCWDLFGGKVEEGESVADALSRELAEELGVHPLTARPLGEIDDPHPDRHGACRYLLFVVEAWTGDPAIVAPEHTAIRWFDPAEAAALPALALDAYRPLLAGLASSA